MGGHLGHVTRLWLPHLKLKIEMNWYIGSRDVLKY